MKMEQYFIKHEVKSMDFAVFTFFKRMSNYFVNIGIFTKI